MGVNVPLMISAVVAISWTAEDRVDARPSATAVSIANTATPIERANRTTD